MHLETLGPALDAPDIADHDPPGTVVLDEAGGLGRDLVVEVTEPVLGIALGTLSGEHQLAAPAGA
ncbi:MAG: hypothetical protein M0Z47_09310, partial [Actinomycetota bacterium]|nr:hypothetical protein [Actinomycetota bacterium]